MRPHLHLLLALALGSSASAAIVTTYADAAAFQSALEPGSYLETFESMPTTIVVSRDFASAEFPFTASAPQSLYTGTGNTGSRFLGLLGATDTLTLTFTGGSPTAVGGSFFNTNAMNNFTAGNVTLTLNDGTPYSFTSLTTGVSPFVGFTTTSGAPITSLTIHSTSGGFIWPSMDNLVVGRLAIPEPSTYALGTGVLALGFALWRRRR